MTVRLTTNPLRMGASGARGVLRVGERFAGCDGAQRVPGVHPELAGRLLHGHACGRVEVALVVGGDGRDDVGDAGVRRRDGLDGGRPQGRVDERDEVSDLVCPA